MPVEQSCQRVFFCLLQDLENVIYEQRYGDSRAEDLGEIASEYKWENQIRKQGEAEEGNGNDLHQFHVASFEKEIDQSSAIRPGNNERQISQRAAGEGVILVYPEDDPCKYRNEVDDSEYDRGDEDIQSLFLHKCIDDLRNNKGRRTVSNRHQNAAQGPVFDLRCAVELYKYDKREQIHADYQNIHTLDRFFIPEDRDPERYRKHRQNQYQRPVLKQIFFYHEISFHNNVISLLYC